MHVLMVLVIGCETTQLIGIISGRLVVIDFVQHDQLNLSFWNLYKDIEKGYCLVKILEPRSKWSTYGAGKKGCTGEGKALLEDGWTYLVLEECKKACEDVSNCNSIAWNSKDNSCFLKHKENACDDRSCDWGRNDAKDWNFYWKTKESLYWKDIYIGRKMTCGNVLLRISF